MDMLFRFINFAVFIFVLAYFLKRPIKEFWEGRRRDCEAAIDAAAKVYETAKSEESLWNARLERIGEEASALINESKREGEFEREDIIRQAAEYAEQIKRDASFAVEYETEKAIAELKKTAVSSAVELVRERLLKETTQGERLRMAERAAAEIGESL